MATKTFTAGSVLTAADTNTYLANAGLVYVASASFSASSAVTVSNCFTSTYNAYRILITTNSSAAGQLQLVLRSGSTNKTTGYYWSGLYNGSGSSGLTGEAESNVGSWKIGYSEASSATESSIFMDLYYPAQAFYKQWTASNLRQSATASNYNTRGGGAPDTGTYDGFQFSSAGGGTLTGKYIVMGYRAA